MSTYNINLTLENIRTISVMFADIFIMWLLVYYILKIVRASSKTIQIFKGILFVVIIDILSKVLGLKTVAYLADMFVNWGLLAFIIIFVPEIRSILERLGKSSLFSRITTLTGNEKENLVDQIVTATMLLSKDQTGALISIEQSHPLDDYISTGTKLNSDVTAELLTSLFVTSTPLHDGAIIIQGDKIACASAYFPPTNLDLPSRYGARHRAAIGISEITDAVTIVVSEETGAISVTEHGQIITVNRKQLRDYLLRVICGEETEVSVNNIRKKSNEDSVRDIIIDDMPEVRAKNAKAAEASVLGKLMLKKQDEKRPGKIEVEEVVSPERNEYRSDFNDDYNDDNSEDQNIERLEEEASDIKLPSKKNRPRPSYPKNSTSKHFDNDKKFRDEQQRLDDERKAEEARRLEEERAQEEKKKREEERKLRAELDLKKRKEEERAKALEEERLEVERQRQEMEKQREEIEKRRLEMEEEARRAEEERQARIREAEAAAEQQRIQEEEKQKAYAAELARRQQQEAEERMRREQARQEQERQKELEYQREQARLAAIEAERQRQAEEDARLEQDAYRAAQNNTRMTPEEVRAARQAMMAQYSTRKPKKNETVRAEKKTTERPAASDTSKEQKSRFDSSKLDISKLMGMDNDLDKTFEMIDSIGESTSSRKRKG